MPSNTKHIKKSITIDATKEKIWDAMVDLDSYKIWADVFSPGSYAKTDWQEGSKVIFADPSGGGLFGRIIIHRPNQKLVIEYDGQLLEGGVEDTDSDIAKAVKGTHESYILSDQGKSVLLSIESEMGESYYDSMSEAWDVALQKIKELSENS